MQRLGLFQKWRNAAVAALVLGASSSAAMAAAPQYKIVSRVQIPDGGFDYAAFDPANNKIYFARTDYTTVFDTQTDTLSQLGSAAGGHIALPLPGTHMALVTQGRANSARMVDMDGDTVVADIPVKKNPDAALYDTVSKHLFVMNHSSGEVSEIDPATRMVVATISMGGDLEFGVSDGAGKVFVNIEDENKIGVIDVKSHMVTARYAMKNCDGPTGLGYDPVSKLLISSCDGTVKVLQASDGKEVASVATGAGADAVIYDGARHLAFIPCGRSGELDVISLADPKHIAIVQKLMTQMGSRTGTIDPATGRIYMVAAKYEASKEGGRPRPLPGSFEILVVGP